MPDHWHGLFGLINDWTLPRFQHAFMSYVGSKTNAPLAEKGCSWLDGYYDTRIRSTSQFRYVKNYILQNPVERDLVIEAGHWDASSLQSLDIVTDPWPWAFEQD